MSYSLYIAKIEALATPEDDRLQVRVLPEMESLDKSYLPVWPFFFKNQTITGNLGDLVWCIANTEFTMGYVLGYANSYSWIGDYASSSIPTSLKDKLDNVHVELRGKLLSYRDIIVTYWNESSIHFVDRSTGAHITAFTSGTVSIVRPEEIILAVGAKSMIKIDEQEIVLTAQKVRLAGEVRLGNNPQGNVLVTQGVLGSNGLPASSVWA